MHTLSRLLLTGLSAFVFAACGDDGGTDGGPRDSGPRDTGQPSPDADSFDIGFVDVGPRDSGTTDAGGDPRYCTTGGAVRVAGTNVTVGEAPEPAELGGSGAAPLTECIDDMDLPGLLAQITFRSCIQFVGGSTTATEAELAQLEVAVFVARGPGGDATDPTVDPATGRDRMPERRIAAEVVKRPRANVCAGGPEIELGRASLGVNALRTGVEYIVRVRTSSTTRTGDGGSVWATSHHFRTIVRADRIEGGGATPGDCTPQECLGEVSLYAVRRTAVEEAARDLDIAGGENLTDGRGPGYAMIAIDDCRGRPMRNAVAGFSPEPIETGYLVDGQLDIGAGASADDGLFLGLGFTGTSTAAPVQVRGAVGLIRETGACTEEFSGLTFPVFPDAISVMRAGRETTLHMR